MNRDSIVHAVACKRGFGEAVKPEIMRSRMYLTLLAIRKCVFACKHVQNALMSTLSKNI